MGKGKVIRNCINTDAFAKGVAWVHSIVYSKTIFFEETGSVDPVACTMNG